MTGSIYVGAPTTAWNRVAVNAKSREKRLQTRQTNRVIAISVLTIFSLIEGAAVYMGSFTDRTWLEVLSTVCIFFNIPLIVWLGRLWLRDFKRELQIERQNRKGGLV